MIFYIMLPISFLFYFWGDLIFISFYEGGKFSSSNTIKTFSVLKYYSFGLVFISIYHLFVKIFYSVKKYNYVLIISVSAIVVKLLLSALLVKEFKEEGLALSTTLLYVFLMFFAIFINFIEIKVIKINIFLQKIIINITNLMISYFISQLLCDLIQLNDFGGKIISVMFFITSFYFTAYLLNESEINVIKRTIFSFAKLN